MVRIGWVAGATGLALACANSFGQGLGTGGTISFSTTVQSSTGDQGVGANATPGSRPRHSKPGPFTMETKETRVQTYAGGLTVTSGSVRRTARNSAGQMWNENDVDFSRGTIADGQRLVGGIRTKQQMFNVFDAKAQTRTNWIVAPGAALEARVTHMQSPDARLHDIPHAQSEPRQNDGPVAQRVRENLGMKTVFGIELTGTRTTTAYPAAFNGNSVAYKDSEEIWMSAQYGVFERTTESPEGKSTMLVTAFTAGEPDAALFKPPAGYVIVDEKR